MTRLGLAVLTLLVSTAFTGAEEKLLVPKGPQPRQVVARLEPGTTSTLQIRESITVYEVVVEQVTKMVGGKMVVYTVHKKVPVYKQIDSTHELKKLQVYAPTGKKYDGRKLLAALKKWRPVLVSSDGKPVDPFYLQVLKPDTVILILPAPRPVPQPLPPDKK